MLRRFDCFSELDAGKLMAVYEESNFENTDYFFPDIQDKTEAVRKVEEGFLSYLEQDFFQSTNPSYWILEDSGQWISALRLNELEPGFYYLEALETRPDSRRKGYGARLLTEVLEALKEKGPFTLCDCVGKRNEASLRTHRKCGFAIVSDEGYDYLNREADSRVYGLQYQYSE